ncbi:MAG: ABC transporter permease [Beijerinckiaceae bacterium]|jgi:ABC-2 type transport system permease protein/capsular polysaccharide transport system permease protein|nr:ABC transporter permease [Beijerinckiaceae bacterium]
MSMSPAGPSDGRSALAAAFEVQRRVIWALLLREMITRYGRHNFGFLWLFLEPMLFTLAVTLLWVGLDLNHVSSLPITAFAVTGYSSILLWRNMPGRLIGSIGPNLALMFHRQVKVIDIFLSRLALEFMGATISFIVLTVLFTGIDWMALPEDLLQVCIGWLLLAWFGAGLAILLGALAEDYDIVEKLWHPFAYLILPLSGAAFTVDTLPPAGQQWILYLPMVNAIEYLREGYFGSVVHAHYDLAYLISVNLLLTGLGLAKTRVVSQKVVPE